MGGLSYHVGGLPSRGHKGEAKFQAKQAKNKALDKAKKMVKISHKGHIGYSIEDHKGNVLKKG